MHLAREHKALSEMELAAKELVKVYREYAEEKESGGAYNEAVEFYSKGLEAARASRDRTAEGIACHRLGKTYVAVDQAQTAINYLHEFERICTDLDDLQGQGDACAALAAAYQSIGDDDKAVEYLETYLSIASKTENLTAQGVACCALGVIFNKRGEFKRAVEHFEKNVCFADGVADRIKEHFRQYLRSSNERALRDLLRFATGSESFNHRTTAAKRALNVVEVANRQLPAAHTCENELEVWDEEDFGEFQSRLQESVKVGLSGGFQDE